MAVKGEIPQPIGPDNLIAYISSNYPFIQTAQDFKQYQEGKSAFCSFSPDSQFSSSILEIALRRASDSKSPAYASHAARHNVFPQAVNYLVQALRERKKEMHIEEDKIVRDFVSTQITKLFLQGETQMRAARRPGPYRFIKEVQKAIEEKKLKEEESFKFKEQMVLRSTAAFGVPFGIIAGVYSLITEDRLFELFTQNVAAIKAIRDRAGLSSITISDPNQHESFIAIYQSVRGAIMNRTRRDLPFFSATAYLAMLGDFPEEYTKEISDSASMIQVWEETRPVAVFRVSDEVAQLFIRDKNTKPGLNSFIKTEYKGKVTTQLATAYLSSSVPEEKARRRFNSIIFN